MFVLIACEESQRVCIEFRKLGHVAFSCDVVSCSGGRPEWHIQGDVVPLLNGDCEFFTCDGCYHALGGKWDLIIAHPPCTYLSKAGARWLYPTKGNIDKLRYEKGLAARDFFTAILNCDCERVCVENPIPLKVFDLPECTQIVQPYYFGEPFSKATCLWLKGLPLLAATNLVEPLGSFCPSNTGNFSRGCGGSRGAAKRSKFDARERSKTFRGIAAAMAEQWGGATT